MITTKKVCAGNFEVYNDDLKTKYSIVNGCLGASGSGANVYGITDGQKTIWIGSLQKCKKTVALWLAKQIE